MQPIKVKIMKIKSLMGPLKSGEVSPVPPPPTPSSLGRPAQLHLCDQEMRFSWKFIEELLL